MSVFLELDGKRYRVDPPSALRPEWKVSEGENAPVPLQVDVHATDSASVSVLWQGRSLVATLDTLGGEQTVAVRGRRFAVKTYDPKSLAARRGSSAAADGAATLKSPMPGRVVRLLCQPDDIVAAKQGILVVEAMKMQNELKAPKAGRIGAILVAAGDTVAANQPLATVL